MLLTRENPVTTWEILTCVVKILLIIHEEKTKEMAA